MKKISMSAIVATISAIAGVAAVAYKTGYVAGRKAGLDEGEDVFAHWLNKICYGDSVYDVCDDESDDNSDSDSLRDDLIMNCWRR